MRLFQKQAAVKRLGLDPELIGEETTEVICTCPFQRLHTKSNGERDTILYLENGPYVHCFHQSCQTELEKFNYRMLLEITGSCRRGPPIQRAKNADKIIEEKFRSYRAGIVATYTPKMRALAEVELSSLEFIKRMYQPEDIVWIGRSPKESGFVGSDQNFVMVGSLTQSIIDNLQPVLICGSVFAWDRLLRTAKGETAFSRCDNAVLMRRYVILESDVHTETESRAIFEWIEESLHWKLRAIVFSGGTSLHGWFEPDTEKRIAQAKPALIGLGFDPNTLRLSHPQPITENQTNLAMDFTDLGTEIFTETEEVSDADREALRKHAEYFRNQVWFAEYADKYYVYNHKEAYWQRLTEKNLLIHMQVRGLFRSFGPLQVRWPDWLAEVLTTRAVAWVGELAGYQQGVYTRHNYRILIPRGLNLIEPSQGDWTFTREFIEHLLGEEQTPYFYSWLQWALNGLRAQRRTPGHCLILVGPADCGKTALLTQIIHPVLGGRSADGSKFLKGATTFNAEMAAAESLYADDQNRGLIFDRDAFSAGIKAHVANPHLRVEAKYVEAMTHEIMLSRLTIAVNETPACLSTLPVAAADIRDKLLLFGCFNGNLGSNIIKNNARFAQERAAFVHFLLHEFTIPQEIAGGRFGFQYYLNSRFEAEVSRTTGSDYLRELYCTFTPDSEDPVVYRDTATGYLNWLVANDTSPGAGVVRSLATTVIRLGHLFVDWASSHPGEVQHTYISGRRHITVTLPPHAGTKKTKIP
jgi:hypothetical protein